MNSIYQCFRPCIVVRSFLDKLPFRRLILSRKLIILNDLHQRQSNDIACKLVTEAQLLRVNLFSNHLILLIIGRVILLVNKRKCTKKLHVDCNKPG